MKSSLSKIDKKKLYVIIGFMVLFSGLGIALLAGSFAQSTEDIITDSLTSRNRAATYAVELTASSDFSAELTFLDNTTRDPVILSVTLYDNNDTALVTQSSASNLSIRAPLAAGSYKLIVSTADALEAKSVRYSLKVANIGETVIRRSIVDSN